MKVNILNTAQLNADNESFRLDSEHYTKWNLDLRKKLEDIGSKELSNFIKSKVVTGHTPSMKNESYYGGDIKFIKTDNLREFYVSDGFSHYLSPKGDEKINRSSLKERDVILTIIGATYDIVGRTSLITKKDLPSNINQNIAIVRLKETLPPELLVVYLNTNYGRGYLWYLSRQTEQVNLNCREVENLLVPPFGEVFQNAIKSIVVESYAIRDRSDSVYSNSEKILLSELGLLDWKPKHALSFIRNYSDTEQAERFDAEYFQPKYDEIIKVLNKKFKACPIGNIDYIAVTTGQYVVNYVSSNEGKPYIRGTDITNGTINTDSLVYIHSNDQEESKKAIEGDVVVTRVGTIGLSARIPKECAGGSISDNLIRLRFDQNKLDSYYVAAYLGSVVGKSLMIRNSRGSVQQRLNQETLKEIVLPIISDSKQKQIAKQIIKAEKDRQKSKRLLDIAKKAVEMAIEKDEKSAMQWLKEQTQNN